MQNRKVVAKFERATAVAGNIDPNDTWFTFAADPDAATMIVAYAQGRLTRNHVVMDSSQTLTASRENLLVDYFYASLDRQAQILQDAQQFLDYNGMTTDEGFANADFTFQTNQQ